MWNSASITNESGGEVEFCLFDDGRVGVIPNDATAREGRDVFEEEEFIRAIWTLYPDGLPEPEPEPLSGEEQQIRALTLYLLKDKEYGQGDFLAEKIKDYDTAMEYWDVSGPEARKKAEDIQALYSGVEF